MESPSGSNRSGTRQSAVSRLLREDAGQGLVEYALLMGVVVVLVVSIVLIFREAVVDIFNDLGTYIDGVYLQ